jgi:hypothetical protein
LSNNKLDQIFDLFGSSVVYLSIENDKVFWKMSLSKGGFYYDLIDKKIGQILEDIFSIYQSKDRMYFINDDSSIGYMEFGDMDGRSQSVVINDNRVESGTGRLVMEVQKNVDGSWINFESIIENPQVSEGKEGDNEFGARKVSWS